ncbi:MAG: hypothetical protein MI975_25790 [Cytophagales bacterium]|nr:hypothetical protein [Cytophagales bacterium]
MKVVCTQKFLLLFAIGLICTPAHAQVMEWNGQYPDIGIRKISSGLDAYTTVLKPAKDQPEYWAGAPSVVRDDEGTFWMAARMRSPEHPRGLRGYEIRILKSDDGVKFRKVHSIRREEVPIPGFERPALLIDPKTKKFKLYACGPWKSGPWAIIKFEDADDPTKFIANTARAVIQPPAKQYDRDVSVLAYKDPFIIHTEGKYHCYVIGYIRQNERLFHYVSEDGVNWEAVGDVNQPIMDLSGWHNFFIRPASVVPLGIGYLFVYEGSSTTWYDPVYNIVTGLAFTFDLHHIIDLTPESPLALSSTPGQFHTWRYSHWMMVDRELFVYAEVANPNHSHEVRLFRIPMD